MQTKVAATITAALRRQTDTRFMDPVLYILSVLFRRMLFVPRELLPRLREPRYDGG